VRRLARQATATHGEVIVTGTVPDLRPYLQRAAVAVAPIAYGAGIQNKVLEAMACAAPVVTTPQAVSALDLGEEEGVLVADNAVGLAESVLALLADGGRRHRLGQAGREYVSRRHNWSNIVADLVEIYADSIERSVAVCIGAASALPNRETILAPTQTPT
jgi:glycosyltransferase involved in cell wall biosynthesis